MYAYEKKTKYSYAFRTPEELSYICRRNALNIPVSKDVSPLSRKVTVRTGNGRLTLKNAIAVHPMDCLDALPNGSPSSLTKRRWLRFSASGASMIYCGVASVFPRSGGRLCISNYNIQEYKTIINEMRAGYSPVLILQLSADGMPAEADRSLLPSLFARSAEAAFKAGFDGVDVRLPRSGESQPEYKALLYEILSAVSAVSPKCGILSLRYISDFSDAGPDFIYALSGVGLSVISVTAGSQEEEPDVCMPANIPQSSISISPLTAAEKLLSEAQRIKMLAPDVCVIASGLSYFKELAPFVASGAIESGMCDMVGFGRMALASGSFADDFISYRTDAKKSCVACGKCTKLYLSGETVGCPIRDQSIYLPILRKVTDKK